MPSASLTIPEVFVHVRNSRGRTLYTQIYSILVITGKLTEFTETPVNDLPRFLNLIGTHMPGTWEHTELEDGLRGVHYAIQEGAAAFVQRYCEGRLADIDSDSYSSSGSDSDW
jgi:hypothetical protein